MSGSNTANHSGTYGATTGNTGIPGTRMTSGSWTDSAGNFWLFGGYGYDSVGDNGVLNDLWKFNPATATWTWMSGSNTRNQSGTYGATTGTTGMPGARLGVASWTDSAGNLWLFGGNNGSGFTYNDLWKFNPATATWTWVSGSKNIGTGGTYGATTGTTGMPGARAWPAYWTDSTGKFWLFGGYGEDGGSNSGDLNDLWEFDPVATTWTWVSGSSSEGQSGTYGATTGTTGTPGCRYASASWTDSTGNFWIFGGYGHDSAGNWGDLNDLWKFSPSAGTWTWISGGKTQGKPGTYGATTGTTGTPGCRGWSASWIDSAGKFWLFGGYGYDSAGNYGDLSDLWKFDPATTTWTWVSGSNTINQSVSYGGATATPGGRNSPAFWIDSAGNFWLFGGEDVNGNVFNDLWAYQP